MKTYVYGGMEVWLHHSWPWHQWWVVCFTPWSLLALGKEYLDRKLCGLQNRPGYYGEEKKLAPAGTRTPAFQSVVRSYTYWAIRLISKYTRIFLSGHQWVGVWVNWWLVDSSLEVEDGVHVRVWHFTWGFYKWRGISNDFSKRTLLHGVRRQIIALLYFYSISFF
jgi:hypothetical protein